LGLGLGLCVSGGVAAAAAGKRRRDASNQNRKMETILDHDAPAQSQDPGKSV
jgi:hypothetical protein